jgi:glycosyltransferase involved in cell wall biosynthesis
MKFLDNHISESVLTVGCQHLPPRGGVAQVLYIYDEYIFTAFNKLTDTREGNKFEKLWQFVTTYMRLFTDLLFDRKIKIVHIHTSSYNSFRRASAFVRLAYLMRRKIILHVHGGNFKEFYHSYPKQILAVLNICDCIIALSESWKNFFDGIVNGPVVKVVENPIEPPQYSLLGDDDIIHMLFLGLIADAKGIFDLLDVINAHKDLYKGRLVLHVAGNGEVDRLQNLIHEYGLDDVVCYEGWVSGPEKTFLMNKCSVFVLPSYSEGLPVSILEAMSYGQYIVATDVGGIPEIVDQECGILFQPGDKDLMKNILDRLAAGSISLPDKDAIIERSRKYLPQDIAGKLKEIYSEYL